MPKIPPGYMPLEDALAELGPALIGKGWIGELTKRERWLVEKHKSGRSIIDGSISYVGPWDIPLDLRTERDAALNRDSTMRSQREQAIEWLEDHDLLFETADGDEDDDDDAVVPVAEFRAALKAAGLSVAPPAAPSAPAAPTAAVPPGAAPDATAPAEASAETAPATATASDASGPGVSEGAADARRGLTKEDSDAAYRDHIEDIRKARGRYPTRHEDEAWGRNKNIRRERVRELRRNHMPQSLMRGGAPKKNPAEKLGGK